ncbi:Leo1-like protein-domain-containing protein [Lipomyces oligophaga]|uniref:Leo1-like protein-domain-containing protein n=1 Tax=Lipomyces oligophaga TaxID=45792 RepID=UPI0034CE3D22
MSDSESSADEIRPVSQVNRTQEQAALNDLFDQDDDSDAGSGQTPVAGTAAENLESPNDAGEAAESDQDDIFGDAGAGSDQDQPLRYTGEDDLDEEEDDEQPEYEEVETQEMEIQMPRYLPSHSAPKEVQIMRIPNFLNVDYSAFDRDRYLEQAEDIERARGAGTEEARQRLRADVQNTIRWRNVTQPDGSNKVESNARIMRWSDGSFSIKLGSEVFDIQESLLNDTYLAISHNDQEIVQFHSKVSKMLNLIPSSTTSETHVRMSNALARGQLKARFINDIITTEDPEKVQREAEKAEESKMRARKNLENKRRSRDSRAAYDRELGAGIHRLADSSASSTQAKSDARRANRYDDEDDDDLGYGAGDTYEHDDFVVSDDDNIEQDQDEDEEEDEDEERAARLRKVKRDGAEKYKNRKSNSEVEEEEEDMSE